MIYVHIASAPSVSQDSSVNRALILFQALGLRHLIVTDKMNCVIGILTRKDLLGFRLDEKLHHSSDDRIFEPNPLVEATKYRASTNYSPKSSSEIRKRTNRGSASWNENVCKFTSAKTDRIYYWLPVGWMVKGAGRAPCEDETYVRGVVYI